MTVITISRQAGSGGDEIAQKLGEKLGYQIFNKLLISQVAAEYGLEQEVIDYSEDQHKVRGFFERLFERSAMLSYPYYWVDTPQANLTTHEMRTESALSLVQKAVWEAYQRGQFIIVGRAGQIILRDKPNVLHIRIEAPLEHRIQRVKEQMKSTHNMQGTTLDLRREAQEWIEERDEASADYIKSYYHNNWNDPMLYHLLINTGQVTLGQAVTTIFALAKEIEAMPFTIHT